MEFKVQIAGIDNTFPTWEGRAEFIAQQRDCGYYADEIFTCEEEDRPNQTREEEYESGWPFDY